MVINGLKIGDEAVYEAERVNEILKFERPGELAIASFQPPSLGMMARSSLAVRILGLSFNGASRGLLVLR